MRLMRCAMIYLDTNVLIYAFCKNVDNEEQKKLSQEILKSSISNQKLLLSEIVLYEFSFVSQKLKEDKQVIELNLAFLSKFAKLADIKQEVLSLMQKTDSYQHSFDVYHVCFSDYFNCSELITFDNGFKKFIDHSKTAIKVLC